MAASFDFRGLHCFAPATPGGPWSYLPGAPGVQRGPDGRPLVAFIDLGTSAYLMFTARWNGEGDVSGLRTELAARGAGAGLERARLDEVTCNVLVADGRGGFVPLASSTTSGVPPYDAVFNLLLNGESLAHGRAALRGETGHFAIEYRGTRVGALQGRATFSAAGPALADYWRAHEGEATPVELLARAVTLGVARIDIDVPGAGSGALASELRRRVLERAAHVLPPMLRRNAGMDTRAEVALERDAGLPTRAFADLGALVGNEFFGSLIGGHHAED